MSSTGHRYRRLAAAAVLVLAAGTACSAPQPQLADTAAQRLQSRAAAIRAAAAGGEYKDALKALDRLAEDLTRAAGQGDVSFPRYQSIEAAAAALRADLNAHLKASAPPSAKPSAAAHSPAPATAAAQDRPSPVAAVAPALPAAAATRTQAGNAKAGNAKAGHAKAGKKAAKAGGNNGRGQGLGPGGKAHGTEAGRGKAGPGGKNK